MSPFQDPRCCQGSGLRYARWVASFHTCCDEMRGTLSPNSAPCVCSRDTCCRSRQGPCTHLPEHRPTQRCSRQFLSPTSSPCDTAVSWSQVPPGSRCRMNSFSFLSWYYPFCLACVFLISTNNIPGLKEVHKWQGLACMGLNNVGICRPLRCSHTLKDEFLSSAVSAPSSLLVALSKDVGREALSAHCTWMQMAMAHYRCLFHAHKCGSMASRKERDTLMLIGSDSQPLGLNPLRVKQPFHSGRLSDILHVRYLYYS